ncbi:MAG TPA: M12 family metallo-peptidase [Pyrinomonadaceae bacterium]|nr:M12 family metallo-peptidase [Pyrinomonadaceae bacterium]
MATRYDINYKTMRHSSSLRTFLLLLAVCVFAVASLWPATPPALSAAAESPVASAFTPQSSDALWRDVKVLPEQQRQTAGRPNKYRSLSLDTIHLQSLLRRAPREFTAADAPIISLPMPDGSMLRFKIYDSPVMEQGLASRFPQIRTFTGQALDGSAVTTRFDWTPQGFHAILLTTRGTVLIAPDAPNQTSSYIAFFQGDLPAGSMECDVDTSTGEPLVAVKQMGMKANLVSSGAALRTYRLAVATTAEYTQTYGGGTVAGGLSAVTTTVNLVNAIFERDVAIRLVLIANEDQIIFTDSVTDGYTSDNVNSLIGENQAKLDAVIGSANYDIGHVFDGGILPGGFQFQGLASLGVVCRTGVKGRGVNIVKSRPPSDVVTYYSAAHEMGHQFGATHTFNATSGTCGPQRAAATAYEPGTGSTIMGYRFACGLEDMESQDTYFHTASIEQIVAYSTGINGGSCPVTTPTGNNIPTVDAGLSYTIPQSTPFMLTATGSDPDNDSLTYTWEEFDLGTPGPPNTDDGSRPIFRSFAPTTNPARLFPSLLFITCPQCFVPLSQSLGESLPLTTRQMKFRATVRDNRAGAGAASSDETTVNVRAEAGPFTVNRPDTWNVKTLQTVTWNVANTNNAPVSCDTVRISLSRDGGITFPIILANSTPNDGSETVVVPGTPNPNSRIKVEAVGNIFFNISPPFEINGVEDLSMQLSSSGYTVNEGAGFVNVHVTRGDTSGAATVNYATSDAAGLTNCTIANGVGSERCDYATAVGTLRFEAGESSKTITIPIVDDVLAEGNENFTVTLSGATGTPLGSPQVATITITDDDGTTAASNPIDDIPFFVTQQYIDFLGRLPDATGFANWVATLNGCPNGGFGENLNPGCDRVHVSAGFFLSAEFQGRGYFAYRFYEVALNRRPTYAEFVPDMALVGGPQSPESEVLSKQAYTAAWTQRPAFKQLYDGLNNSQYVNALEANAEVTVSNRQALIDALNGNQMNRGEVLRNIAESQVVANKFFNRAFVSMQYFGYLRRDPDTIGFQNWLDTLNSDPSNFRHMIFGFLFSTEYRQRFGP